MISLLMSNTHLQQASLRQLLRLVRPIETIGSQIRGTHEVNRNVICGDTWLNPASNPVTFRSWKKVAMSLAFSAEENWPNDNLMILLRTTMLTEYRSYSMLLFNMGFPRGCTSNLLSLQPTKDRAHADWMQASSTANEYPGQESPRRE